MNSFNANKYVITDLLSLCERNGKSLFETLVTFLSNFKKLAAVSYTHLDVYKRQVLDSWNLPQKLSIKTKRKK